MRPNWLDALLHADARITGWAKAVAAVAGAVGAVLAVVFVVMPKLKPAEPCKGQERRGVLSKVVVDRSVTYGGYLRLVGGSTSGVEPQRLRTRGKLIGVNIDAEGYKGKGLPIHWTVLTEPGEPVADPELVDRLALTVTPEDCSDSGRRRVWAQDPSDPGLYKVELTLLDDDDEPLDAARSGVFRIAR
jgi:hypothetical protein